MRDSIIRWFMGIVGLYFMISCSPYRLGNLPDYQNRIIPPNCIEISDNFFIDKSDIKNIDYFEFMYWTERIFGTNSDEFQRIIPDTVKNHVPEPGYEGLWSGYFGSLKPEAMENPLGKISDEQFRIYSEWRTDRVYEMLLSRFSILAFDTAQTAGHYFTIDNYYNGNYTDSKPDTVLSYFPVYNVPTPEDIMLIGQNTNFSIKAELPWSGYRNVCRWMKIVEDQ